MSKFLSCSGVDTEIYEKNAVPGGQCTGWKREGYFIDNCIHWLTGTRPGSALHELWKEIGALGDGVEVHEKEMFFSSKLDGQTLTFWRDKERTRREMLDYMPPGYQAYAFLVSYGTVTKGNDATTHLSLLYCVYNCVCDIL